LRTKHDTPKYGLIYHASLVGLASSKLKGKISRSLAAKCALCIRVDALGENVDGRIGESTKTALEARIRQMEKGIPAPNKGPGMGKRIEKYNANENIAGVYNADDDVQLESTKLLNKKKKKTPEPEEDEEVVEEEQPKKKKKKTTA
jgi:nucleolar protein 58